MKIYAHYGFKDFVLALGYKADSIKNYFLNQRALTSDFTLKTKKHTTTFHDKNKKDSDDFNITFVDTGLETLPGERILMCKKYIPQSDKYFMVTYGDGVANINLKNLMKFHKKQKTIGTITGVHPRSKFGLVKTDNRSLVQKFKEKPILSEYVNGGFMIFNKGFFKYLNPGEMEHEGLKRLAAKNQLSLYKHDDFWYSVDTFKELKDLNKYWEQNPSWKVWK